MSDGRTATDDSATPLRVAIGVHVLLLLYCLFVLPESNTKRNTSQPSARKSFAETAMHPFKLLSSNRNLTLLAAILLVVTQINVSHHWQSKLTAGTE